MPPYRAKKRLGQNFLKSEDAIARIVAIIEPRPDRTIVEIGPGRGALTLPLGEAGSDVIGVEFDRDLTGYLNRLTRRLDNVRILNQDFLDFDPDALDLDRFTLVGNLPYNITTPVLEWAVQHHEQLDGVVLMMQKEVGTRLSSSPGQRDWSPLAIFTQMYFSIESCFTVDRVSFHPRPRVSSVVIKLTPRRSMSLRHPLPFRIVVRQAFRQRRKLLVNNLVPDIIPSPEVARMLLEELEWPANVRAEQLSSEQFEKLSDLLVRNGLL